VPTPVSVVILTRGDRPAALHDAIQSVREQRGVEAEVVVVLNGTLADVDLPNGVVTVELSENVGIPEGRNIGLRAATAPVVAFLDDDGRLLGHDVLARSLQHFDDDPRLAVVAWRIVDEAGQTAQRHVPRPGARSAATSGAVAGFLGGASTVRREAFEDVGGYAGDFFYAMEETDLTWRLVDRGWTLWYDAEATMFHPATTPTRHADAITRTARNRAWAAHRNLPWAVLVVHVALWTLITGVRGGLGAMRTSARSTLAAMREPLGPRRPMHWRTVWQLSRLGRPPLL
jgi:GT2 family glycosyltransferase